MVIDPNLIAQVIITIGNILLEIQRQQIALEGKTQKELLEVLRKMNEQMIEQEDLVK